MAKRVSNDIGTWFQKHFWDLLLEIRDEIYPCWVHEFVDSKQARGMVRPQPSDFMAQALGVHSKYLEAKASEKHDSLRSCFAMVRDTQLSAAKTLTLVGSEYTVWFYSEPLNQLEVWDGAILAEHRATGKKLKEPLQIVQWDDLKTELKHHLTKTKGK
jgi:hypothetical protein